MIVYVTIKEIHPFVMIMLKKYVLYPNINVIKLDTIIG